MEINVSMVSLGCCKNQVDAELMLADLQNNGFILKGDVAESDVVIVNTCGFIQSAKEEAIENILELAKLKEENTIKAIIVTGCLAQRYKEELSKEFPEVSAVLGIGSNKYICEAVKKAMSGEKMFSFEEKEELSLNGERVLTTLPYYAYIKVAEGCDNCCSYCAIPQIRGRFRSRPMEEIVAEAEKLAKDGVKELIVVAQDTSRYGEDLYGSYKLAELLKKLCEIDGLVWIRTLYCYPDKITDELLSVVANEEKLVKYFDIPIQHCNGEILKSMNRKQNQTELKQLFARIRKAVPNVTLRTTLITGYPDETDEQFTELSEFVDEIKFDRLGCFQYSAEEGTKAATMPNQIEDDVKARREEIIMSQQAIIMENLNKEKIGQTIQVLVEGYDKFGECFFGRSKADAPDIDGKIFFESKNSYKMGDFAEVIIEDILDYDLVGSDKAGIKEYK